MTVLPSSLLGSLETSGEDLETPAFVYNTSKMAANIAALRSAIGTPVIASIKACPCPDVLAQISGDVDGGFEVASRGELAVAATFRNRLFVNTPALNDDLVRAGIGAGVHFTVDHPAQIERIASFRSVKKMPPLVLRVNTTALARYGYEEPRGRTDHFGMDFDDLARAIEMVRGQESLSVGGLHCFAGSYRFGAAEQRAEAIIRLSDELENLADEPIDFINFGGGLSENWMQEDHDFAAYRRTLGKLPPHISALHEFGRAIFGEGGVFVTRVVSTKKIEDRHYAVCDGGIAQAFLLAGTENTLPRRREATLVRGPRCKRPKRPAHMQPETPVYIAGASCSKADIIGIVKEAPDPGDLLVFPDCGAYVRTYAMPSFLSLGEARVYVM